MFIYLYVSYKMKKLNLTESCQYVACAFSLVNKTSAIPFSLFFFAFFFFFVTRSFFHRAFAKHEKSLVVEKRSYVFVIHNVRVFCQQLFLLGIAEIFCDAFFISVLFFRRRLNYSSNRLPL